VLHLFTSHAEINTFEIFKGIIFLYTLCISTEIKHIDR
jgi:hypothetical protein